MFLVSRHRDLRILGDPRLDLVGLDFAIQRLLNNYMRKHATLPFNPWLTTKVKGSVVADQQANHVGTDRGTNMPPCMELWVGNPEGKVLHNVAHPEINVPVTIGYRTDESRQKPQSLNGVVLELRVDLDDARHDDEDHKGEGRLKDNEFQQVVFWSSVEHDNGSQQSI